jgi:outer membrane murein-binding lipoprotein Lpp
MTQGVTTMDEEKLDSEEQSTDLVKIEEMSLDEEQLAEQLYSSAGLGPVVEAGLKDYDKRIQKEDKLISKVFGPRGSDIKGYGDAVARRVAFAVYALLNKQYGGKVGDLRSYIMALEDERNRANDRYDELMGRVVGILGDEYKELRTDSKEFMEKLTATLGEDLKASKIDQSALAERLADIDGLRSHIKALDEEKKQQAEGYESQITALKDEHKGEVEKLEAKIAELDSKVKELESEKTSLAGDLARLTADHNRLKTAVAALAGTIPHEEIGKKLGEELHSFILKDSKVPDMVIEGVGKFIDFKKYLGMAAEQGAQEATKCAETTLGEAMTTSTE